MGLCDFLALRQLLKLHKDIISSDKIFPSLATSARDEMNRDIDYILGGLDKLYTTSTSLTGDQVKQSSEMADDRLAKKVVQIKERIEKKRVEWFDDGQPIVKEGSEAVDAALGREYKDLQSNVSSQCRTFIDDNRWLGSTISHKE